MEHPTILAPDNLGPTICIGEILTEIIATTRGAGFGEAQPLIGPFPSGAPAIFCAQSGRIGGATAMIGAVGDDDFGRLNLARLAQNGVDISAVRIDPHLPTGTAFVRYREDDSRDFVFNMWTSAAGALDWTPQIADLVARAGHLHVMGTLLTHPQIWGIITRAAPIVKARGGTISLDPNLRKELRADPETAARFAQMVAMSDLLLPSGDELYLAVNLPASVGEAAALAAIFALGVGEVVLKRGAQGSTCIARDGTITDAPAFIVPQTDPTGAGDCFGGAYVACRRLGLAVPIALTYANAAGARNVTCLGPMEGVGTRAELDAFIATTQRGR